MKYCTEPRCQFPVDNLTYRVLKDGTKHLVGFCVLHGWKFLPFVVPNLYLVKKKGAVLLEK